MNIECIMKFKSMLEISIYKIKIYTNKSQHSANAR